MIRDDYVSKWLEKGFNIKTFMSKAIYNCLNHGLHGLQDYTDNKESLTFIFEIKKITQLNKQVGSFLQCNPCNLLFP